MTTTPRLRCGSLLPALVDANRPGDEQQRVAGQREPGGCPTPGRRPAAGRPSRRSRSGLLGSSQLTASTAGHARRVTESGGCGHVLTPLVPGMARRKKERATVRDPTADETTEPVRITGATTWPRPLVIVESPAKGKTIAGYLGERLHGDGERRAHPRPAERQEGLQVPEPTRRRRTAASPASTPTTTSTSCTSCTRSKKKVVSELKRALKDADELILATDEDREGEAIGWHVLEVLQPKVPGEADGVPRDHAARDPRGARPSARARHEARRGARGPPHPRPARRVGDVADPVARVRPRARPRRPGRVQSVAVRLVVERERARMAFRSGQWHDLEGTFLARADQDRSAPRSSSSTASASPKAATSIPRPARSSRPASTTSCCSTPTAPPRSPTGCATSPTRSRASTPTRSPNGRARRSRRRRCSRSRAASCGSRRRARWRSRSGSTSGATSPTCGPTARTCRSRRSPRRAPRSASSTATSTCPTSRAPTAARSRTRRKRTRRSGPRATASARPTTCAPSSTATSNGSTS